MNNAPKNTRVGVLISDKIDSITGNITRDREGHFIMTKKPIHSENITIYKTSR